MNRTSMPSSVRKGIALATWSAGALLAIAHPATAQVELDRAAAVQLEAALQARLDSLKAGASFPGATLGVALPGGEEDLLLLHFDVVEVTRAASRRPGQMARF